MQPDDDWTLDAACRGADIEQFYSCEEADIQAAVEVCGRCAVRQQCLDFAMANQESFGVWGGVTEAARRRIFRRERRQRTAARRAQEAA